MFFFAEHESTNMQMKALADIPLSTRAMMFVLVGKHRFSTFVSVLCGQLWPFIITKLWPNSKEFAKMLHIVKKGDMLLYSVVVITSSVCTNF